MLNKAWWGKGVGTVAVASSEGILFRVDRESLCDQLIFEQRAEENRGPDCSRM